jgi:hypothetical protein
LEINVSRAFFMPWKQPENTPKKGLRKWGQSEKTLKGINPVTCRIFSFCGELIPDSTCSLVSGHAKGIGANDQWYARQHRGTCKNGKQQGKLENPAGIC